MLGLKATDDFQVRDQLKLSIARVTVFASIGKELIAFGSGGELINLFSCNTEKFAHQLRDLGRNMVWSQVRSDARRLKREPGEIPHLVDVGENGGVDRKRSLLFHDKLYIGGDKTIMRVILCNGVWTTRARSRLPQNAGLSSVCPYCDMNVPEDILHMWWFCPTWLAIREKFFDGDLEDRLVECFDDLPRAFKTCGVVNNNGICTVFDDEFILATHGMMFTIFKERVLRQKRTRRSRMKRGTCLERCWM